MEKEVLAAFKDTVSNIIGEASKFKAKIPVDYSRGAFSYSKNFSGVGSKSANITAQLSPIKGNTSFNAKLTQRF